MWPGFFAPAAAWLFLLIGPLVLFYFLKLRRQRVRVPSLVLWQQVLQDNRVNSPFQRFKRNILLLLQLLLLILLVLAAMQPYVHGSANQVDRLPILIDNSASMGALNTANGQSRLDAVKEQVGEMIDGLSSDQELALISFSNTARKLTPFTNNPRVLRDALDSIRVQDVPSEIEEALRMTQALARSEPFERVLLLSDGNFPKEVEFDLPFELDYQMLDPAGPNVGITAMSALRAETGRWDVFVSLEATPEHGMSGAVELEQDGTVVGTENFSLEPGQIERIRFTVQSDNHVSLKATFIPDGFDSMSADNVGYLDLEPARPLWAYVDPSLTTYRLVLEAMDDVRVFPSPGNSVDSTDRFDLIISNKLADLSRSAPMRIFDGVVPNELQPLIEVDTAGTSVVDWERTAPLLDHVNLNELMIYDNPVWQGEAGIQQAENRGYEILAHGRLGPLILQHNEGQSVSYYTTFRTEQSTLIYRVAFPIMVSNAVKEAMIKAGLGETRGSQTGTLPEIADMLPDKPYGVSTPAGTALDVASDQRGVITGVPAYDSGIYTVRGHGSERQVGVSLLSPRETKLDQVAEIQFGELSVAATAQQVKVDKSLWPWLAAFALAVMLVEWWFFNRRPGGYANA